MSGIINSVGSRSGVIGSTEIPGGYEEGTWTPTTGGTSSETVNRAKYIKIGNQVTISFDLSISTIGTGSTTTLSGLPFANPSDNLTYPVNIKYFVSLAHDVIWMVGDIANNGSTMTFNTRDNKATQIDTSSAILGNSTRIIGTGTYFINIA